MKVILLILPLFMCMFCAMCVGAVLMMTGVPAEGTGTVDVGGQLTVATDGSDPVTTVLPPTGEGCITLFEHYDQDGENNRQFCLDNGKTEMVVDNLKSYNWNDKATSISVSDGISVDLFVNDKLQNGVDKQRRRLESLRVDGPDTVNLKDKWYNDALTSFKMWKRT